jgi:hypothetical protein
MAQEVASMRAAVYCTRQIHVRKVPEKLVGAQSIIRTDHILVYGGVFSYCLTGMIDVKRSVA